MNRAYATLDNESVQTSSRLHTRWPQTYEQGVNSRLPSPALKQTFTFQPDTPSPESFGILSPHDKNSAESHQHYEVTIAIKSSFQSAVFNSVNVLLGVGILSGPFALRSSGMLAGGVLFIFFAGVTNYTGKLLGKCLGYQAGMQTYPDIGQAAFGMYGRVFISVVFFTELFTATAMFYILMGDTLAALVPSIAESKMTIICYLIVLPTTWTRHLSLLSYFSIIGILSSIFCLYTILYVGLTTDNGEVGSLTEPQPVQWIASNDRVPLSIGLTMVAFGGHSVFPSICSSMKRREEFPRVLNIAYSIVAIIYGAVELCGYFMYGEMTKKEITLNLMDTFPGHLVKLMLWTIVLNPMSKLAITLNPVALAVEELFLDTSERAPVTCRTKTVGIFIRTALATAALMCALFVPEFARITSFIGAFFAMLVSVFFPCVCYLRLFWSVLGEKEKWLNVLIATISLVLAYIGTVASFSAPVS
uniref:Amino Acid/Auxin Permease (AAAP) Family putative n=1 Tax=Albugo laibachii Nc14 TaxID=890382 RepID=F0VZ35_9STRA|nr:Amino Acid/Auxin Permease (AAAP) Family putative [Albugo laibachii Nc14]|eukprot:CCA14050.1 Amino Acid/Auxin Permease (AAAP) Family putative [Albugo laibachii Nc14]